MFSGCLIAFAASRPRPALRAGDRSLALAVSLDPANAIRRWGTWRCGFHGVGKVNMLQIYQVILDAVENMQPLVRRIELRDKDLGRQLRRASCSIALNTAEGMYSRGKNRQLRYHTALGSARETLACLELAQRCCAIAPTASLGAQLNRIIGTLVRLTCA